MLLFIFIFIESILSEPNLKECQFADSINSLSSDTLQLTPTTINKYHFSNIRNFFNVTFEK